MKKDRLLNIQQQLNAKYANRENLLVENKLNLLNAMIYEMVNFLEKDQPIFPILETIKEDRENLSPTEDIQIEMMDFLIYELENLLFSKT
jgi:hypothetical protein